jgi:hypothetical protein
MIYALTLVVVDAIVDVLVAAMDALDAEVIAAAVVAQLVRLGVLADVRALTQEDRR